MLSPSDDLDSRIVIALQTAEVIINYNDDGKYIQHRVHIILEFVIFTSSSVNQTLSQGSVDNHASI